MGLICFGYCACLLVFFVSLLFGACLLLCVFIWCCGVFFLLLLLFGFELVVGLRVLFACCVCYCCVCLSFELLCVVFYCSLFVCVVCSF